MTPENGTMSGETRTGGLPRRLRGAFRVTPWRISLSALALLALIAGMQPPARVAAQQPADAAAQQAPAFGWQRPPAEPAQNCPGARPSTAPPLNPQGQPWEREEGDGGLGYCDTPIIPSQKWRVHDNARPDPRVVTPGTESTQEKVGKPPSDAVVLLDGTEATYLAHWIVTPRGPGRGGPGGGRGPAGAPNAGGTGGARGGTSAAPASGGAPSAAAPAAPQDTTPRWKFEDGHITAVQGTGGITSKDKFSGPLQIHIELASNPEIVSKSQFRGNSGILIMNRYEIQVLDSYQNQTYADGSAASIYGQWPPLVNASRKPGEWQSYDMVWEPPDFDHLRPAYLTMFHNGLLVHNHQMLQGAPVHRRLATYTPHEAEAPLSLQNHGERVNPWFRFIWVRKVTEYDEQ